MDHGRTLLVCGFGIIGLTTAVRLLEAGFAVVAVAAHLPGDPLDPAYASTAAGAHHLSFAADDDHRQQRLDRITFDVMNDEERHEGDTSALLRLTQKEYYGTEGEKHIAFFESMPDFRVIPVDELPSFAKHAVTFTSLTMDTTAYLHKLVARFSALGGRVHRARIDSLTEALSYVTEPATNSRLQPLAIVNCTGLGSLHLVDVNDTNVYPVRGQVLVLDAPWIKEGRTLQQGKLDGGEGGARTYIIPRRSGQVIIGGTREADDWHPDPRPETALDIKTRALALFPELCPPSARVPGRHPEPQDLDAIVVREVVGFRPARRGGLRLERGSDLVVEGARIPVLHNVGHAGAGWQSSWGCAEEIVGLVRELV